MVQPVSSVANAHARMRICGRACHVAMGRNGRLDKVPVDKEREQRITDALKKEKQELTTEVARRCALADLAS